MNLILLKNRLAALGNLGSRGETSESSGETPKSFREISISVRLSTLEVETCESGRASESDRDTCYSAAASNLTMTPPSQISRVRRWAIRPPNRGRNSEFARCSTPSSSPASTLVLGAEPGVFSSSAFRNPRPTLSSETCGVAGSTAV